MCIYIYIYIHTDHNGKRSLAKSSFKLKTPIKAFFVVFLLLLFCSFSLCVCVSECVHVCLNSQLYTSFPLFLQRFLNIVQTGKTSLCTELYVCYCIVSSFILIIKFYFSFSLDYSCICWVKAHRLFSSRQ